MGHEQRHTIKRKVVPQQPSDLSAILRAVHMSSTLLVSIERTCPCSDPLSIFVSKHDPKLVIEAIRMIEGLRCCASDVWRVWLCVLMCVECLANVFLMVFFDRSLRITGLVLCLIWFYDLNCRIWSLRVWVLKKIIYRGVSMNWKLIIFWNIFYLQQ